MNVSGMLWTARFLGGERGGEGVIVFQFVMATGAEFVLDRIQKTA